MSSLRDQLLGKGLVSKKQARKAKQELKADRKARQGSKRKKHQVLAEAQAAEAAEKSVVLEERLAARAQASAERDSVEAALRVRNLILGNRVKVGSARRGEGPLAFHHRGRDARFIHRLSVPLSIAEDLRRGDLGVVWLDPGWRQGNDAYVLVPRRVAESLTELAPEVVVHWNSEVSSDPSERPHQKDWEPSLVPHRLYQKA